MTIVLKKFEVHSLIHFQLEKLPEIKDSQLLS